ncbi:hypothetical protein HispidOSU_012076 [Sigmodon hispidus]
MSLEIAGAAAADLPLVEGSKGARGRRANAGACAGPRPARSPGGCTARAPTRAWGPVPARAAWKAAGCSGPAGGSAAAARPLREGRERALVPRLGVPRPKPALRGDPDQAGGGTLGGDGAPEAGRPGRGAVGRPGRTEAFRGLPGRGPAGGMVGARVGCSPAEMSTLLGARALWAPWVSPTRRTVHPDPFIGIRIGKFQEGVN